MKVLEPAVVERRAMCSGPRQPAGDCACAVPKHPYGSSDIETFSQCGQHLAHALGGALEAVQRGIAAGAEGGPTRLAAEGLDALMLAVGAVTNEGMDLRIRAAIGGTGGGRTGTSVGVDAFGGAAPAFSVAPVAE